MGQAGDIAVLGAGIGGLAIATLLAGEGRRVLVFDRFEAPRAVGSGLMIQPTGRAVLERMGLWENLAPLCAPIDRLIGRNEQDRRVLDVRFAALGTGRQGFGTLRGTLFETLLEAAREAGATLLPQSDIEGADAERGTLRLNGGREAGPFALIVDALGLRSPLTKAPRRELPYGALWATLPWPADGDFDPAALEQRYRAASRMAGVMASGRPSPGAPKTATYFWSIKAAQAKDW
ncbi:FAD-dependent oxidoreductase [Parvularcula oceani]|uniref:FAD-dependent oxidoreductase n=1 Tax=Parvularcula oceani TaxID=1247963 RepID=UPI00192E5735|nr:NAD(P)-binding protein [Parvularcula oceani]